MGGSWSTACGSRALVCRLSVSLSQSLPLSGLPPPFPHPGLGHSQGPFLAPSFLWVDQEDRWGVFCFAYPGVHWPPILGILMAGVGCVSGACPLAHLLGCQLVTWCFQGQLSGRKSRHEGDLTL